MHTTHIARARKRMPVNEPRARQKSPTDTRNRQVSLAKQRLEEGDASGPMSLPTGMALRKQQAAHSSRLEGAVDFSEASRNLPAGGALAH